MVKFRSHAVDWLRGLFCGFAVLAGCQPGQASAQVPTASAQSPIWVGAWASPPTDAIAVLANETPPPFADMTLRSTVRLSTGGTAVRLRISNELGTEPLEIGQVTVFTGQSSTARSVTFGAGRIVIPAGKVIVSEPLAMRVKPFDRLVVSVHVPGPTPRLTGHVVGQETVWLAPGDQTKRHKLLLALPGFSRLLLTGVDIRTDQPNAGTLAILGDSGSEGYMSSLDTYHRWPDRLVDRMAGTHARRFGVVNLGISGNRLLRDGDGAAVIKRLERDVFSLPNVKLLLVLIGANDLGTPVGQQLPVPTFGEMKGGYETVFDAARRRGIKIYGVTILPFGNAGPWYYSQDGDRVRIEINDWLKSSAKLDGVIDLAKVCASSSNPSALASFCDSGDGLHPTDRGYDIMAAAVFKQLMRDGVFEDHMGKVR